MYIYIYIYISCHILNEGAPNRGALKIIMSLRISRCQGHGDGFDSEPTR